ncbi:MAG: hypothetical protein IKJ82_01920 [Oscillospiraceae bacterium]|nr:hypothetical protein [Oscillospiraceae bacterium]
MWIDENGFLVFANPFCEGLFINLCMFAFSYFAASISKERYIYLTFAESRLCTKEKITKDTSFFQKMTLFYLWSFANTKKTKRCLIEYWIFWIAYFVLLIGFFLYAYQIISKNEITYVFLGYSIVGLYLLTRGDLISSNKLR